MPEAAETPATEKPADPKPSPPAEQKPTTEKPGDPAKPKSEGGNGSDELQAQVTALAERLEAAETDVEKWKTLSRKHERRQLEALGFDADTAEQILTERKENPKAVAEKVAGYDELTARIEQIEKDRDEARAEAEVARAVADHQVSAEDAPLLNGLTGDALTNLAARLGGDKKAPAAPSTDGAGRVGTPVSGPAQIATREEYAALSPEERRAARKDGRLDQLLGVNS